MWLTEHATAVKRDITEVRKVASMVEAREAPLEALVCLDRTAPMPKVMY